MKTLIHLDPWNERREHLPELGRGELYKGYYLEKNSVFVLGTWPGQNKFTERKPED